jgi:hypothetical protein
MESSQISAYVNVITCFFPEIKLENAYKNMSVGRFRPDCSHKYKFGYNNALTRFLGACRYVANGTKKLLPHEAKVNPLLANFKSMFPYSTDKYDIFGK